jgi:hypothetical protein
MGSAGPPACGNANRSQSCAASARKGGGIGSSGPADPGHHLVPHPQKIFPYEEMLMALTSQVYEFNGDVIIGEIGFVVTFCCNDEC